ncbi:MAG: hypothetical protein LBH59_05730 [Planctomycetaceae bacterium]|jgi:hypothetical protein|nr:hypothetical protein [Planctomycetaceae bacterium]
MFSSDNFFVRFVCSQQFNIPKPVWAVGFALEQTLRVVALTVFSFLILKRLQHNMSQKIAIFFVTIILFGAIWASDFLLQNSYANETETKNTSNVLAEKISPIVNESTFAVAYINLKEINLKSIREQLTKLINRAGEIAKTNKRLNGKILAAGDTLLNEIFTTTDNIIIDLAINAGLSELYFVGALVKSGKNADGNLDTVFFLAVPHNMKDQSDKNIITRQKIEIIFRFLSRQANLLETNLLVKNDLLLYPILPNNTDSNVLDKQDQNEIQITELDRIDEENIYDDEFVQNKFIIDEDAFKNYVNKFSATKNPYLADAFQYCDSDLFKIVFLFGNPVKTFLTQFTVDNDNLPQITNVIRYIIGQINYLSVGIDPVKLRIHALAKARNPMSARQIQSGLSGLTDFIVKFNNMLFGALGDRFGLDETLLVLISFAAEVSRGVANFAIPNCDKDNLTWNYEINPDKIRAEIIASVIIFTCMVCINIEEDAEQFWEKWKNEITPTVKNKP